MKSVRLSTAWIVALSAALCLTVAQHAAAETLLMPNRDFLAGANEVVWGVTTLDNHLTAGVPTTYEFDFNNDGTFEVNGNVTDRSYIAVNRVFPLSGTFTIRMRVTRGAVVEEATTVVNVYDAGAITPEALRGLNVNRAIQDGLRYLWFSQANRATNFPSSVTTSWSQFSFPGAYTSLAVTALQNHGYLLPNNDSVPTGIYQKYLVRRGINFVLNQIRTQALGLQNSPSTGAANANNPCVGGVEAAPCTGLYVDESSHGVYETGLAILPFASSGALDRTVTEVAGTNSGGFVVGKTYREILQRMANAIAWGQVDIVSSGQGGWCYVFNQNCADGSSEGWIMLALLDATAAGATVPAFVKTEWAYNPVNILQAGALARGLNEDGSFDYQANSSRASNNAVNVAKTGVGLQGMYFAGRPLADADAQDALDWISDRWHVNLGGEGFHCSGGIQNKGCGYGMFNVFKALKLYGVTTLPNVNRPAGSIGDPDDWHADYTDWLVANQTTPQSTSGGHWAPLHFSSQVSGNEPAEAALALLILAPTALVLPDPGTFSSVGLQHGNPLTTNPVSNPVGTNHTVTAIATAASGAPVATATVNFLVISGPNVGKSGTGVTNAQGQATFTYLDTAGPGTDQIRASIGQLQSNVVEKIWIVQSTRCDVDGNQVVDGADLLLIRAGFGQVPAANDPRDGNGDGAINIADARYCQLRFGPVAQ